MKEKNIFLGTEFKLNISIAPIESMTMDDYDFSVKVFCLPNAVAAFEKSDAIRVDSNNYILPVNTGLVGTGRIKCEVTAHIPDGDFHDGLRTEVACIDTGIDIVKSI